MSLNRWMCGLTAALFFAASLTTTGLSQENNSAPKGFRALFNGTDLSGWQGMGHFDPYKLAEMSDAERAEFFEKNQSDVEAHWTVEDGAIVNDGQGVYLTSKDSFENFELWVDYRTVAKADSGIYLKRPLKFKSGITPKRAGSGTLEPTKVQVDSGITAKEP